ncbi:MAG TPA: DJ-1/PfpI family protein [candidate division Zixibacteria bacterium]|nr:DJ-1/PfpI family protein [candidate division Zixibacteria bacterium]
MGYTVGIVIYDGFGLLDLVGPFEILTQATGPDNRGQYLFEQHTVGRNKDLVTCHGGIQILPKHIYPDAFIYDVLLVPGGPGSVAATKNLRLMNWFGRAAKLAKVIAAVGNGSFILAASGILNGKKAAYVPGLGEAYPGVLTEQAEGIVQDKKVMTVSGNDNGSALGMAIIEELLGANHVNVILDE